MGYGSRYGVAAEHSGATVSDRIARRQMLDLNDARAQRRNGGKCVVVPVAESVESQPQTAHVESRLGEPLYGGRVGRMAYGSVWQLLAKAAAHCIVEGYLTARIFVLGGCVRAV